MKKAVKVSAPGKLMLFGEHAVVYDRPCIVTAVDHRMSVSIQPLSDRKIEINAPDVGLRGYEISSGDIEISERTPKAARFVLAAAQVYFERHGNESGLMINTKSEFSSKFGFGSSSAVTVGLIAGLSELHGTNLTKHELFDTSYEAVLRVQGVGSGFDLAAAIWGGNLYFVTGGKEIIPLNSNETSLVVGYTGVKADTPFVIKEVAKMKAQDPRSVEQIFDSITIVVEEAVEAMSGSNNKKLGGLMTVNQELLSDLGVSTKELSDLIIAANHSGAYGAKLSGAGGGDCMIALVSEKHGPRIEKSIRAVGGTIIPVCTAEEGVRVENENNC